MIGLGLRIGNAIMGGGVIAPEAALRTNYDTGQNFWIANVTPSVGWYVSFRSDWYGEIGRYYLTNEAFSGNGFFWLQVVSFEQLRFRFNDGTTKNILIPFPKYGDKITLQFLADGWHILVNDVEVGFSASTTFTPITKDLVWGNAFGSTNLNGIQEGLYWDLDVNGQTWDLSEGSGNTATGSLGSVINLTNVPNGDISQMWTTSERFATESLTNFNFKLNPNRGSWADSYENGAYYHKRLNTYPNTNNTPVRPYGYTVNGQAIAIETDDMPPFLVGTDYSGGYHSWRAWESNVAGFNKTAAQAAYSVWQLNGGTHQIIIVGIVATTYVQFTNVDQSLGTPPLGTYDHVSGSTNTTSFTISSITERYVPSVNKISRKLYADGVEVPLAYNYTTVSEYVRYEEIYDVPEKQSWVDYMITLQGTGAFVTDFPATVQLYRVTNNYVFDSSPFITGYCSFELLIPVTDFGHTMFIQQTNLCETGDFWYVPKTKEWNGGNGLYNFSELQPFNLTAPFQWNFEAASYEFADSPPDRVFGILDTKGLYYVQGFLPVLDAAIGVRKDMVDLSINISNSTGKFYMRGQTSDKVGTSLPAGTKFEVRYYRGAMPISTERTAAYFVTDYDTGKGYMYADWHDLPKVDSIPVPTKYQGRTYTVLEKTSNVTLAAGTLGSSLSVSVADTHNYGFVTIEIAV